MFKERRIYLLSQKDLNPETIAVTFAKTSRSPKPFDAIAAELTDESSAQFHEKWVLGYGHASVAEHAVLHIAIENVSRLAIETIENNRLVSYTEKSTRYQQWDQDAFYVPAELQGHKLEGEFKAVCEDLFQTYQRSIPKVEAWLYQALHRNTAEAEQAYARRVKSAAIDICRFLLPAASLANVGITINARSLEYAICKMLSSPIEEVQAIGAKMCEVGRLEAPTLIKYASCNDYLCSTRATMRKRAQGIGSRGKNLGVQLVTWDQDGQDRLLAAILFRFGSESNYHDCADYVRRLTASQKLALTKDLMGTRGLFDQPLREFEHVHMAFEAVMDQGAYFEFKRHRMMTQTVQALTAELGFALPKGLRASGCEEDYLAVMRRAAAFYQELAHWNPDVASYIVPNGFNRRVFFSMNLRQTFHFCHLRAAENAHFSIRRIALGIAEIIKRIYPLIGDYLDVPGGETSSSIVNTYFEDLCMQ